MRVTLPDDERRVGTLEAYGALDGSSRPELASVVELAAAICRTPMATIDLVTESEQHQIESVGFSAAVCAREESLCDVILAEPATVHIPDLTRDPRFADNPFVNGERAELRFYAAAHLRSREGVTFGTLCVFDERPRELDVAQLGALKVLADRIVDVYEIQKANHLLMVRMDELDTLRQRLEHSNDRLASFAGQVTHDLKTPLTTMSLSLELIRDELEDGATAEDLLPLISRALGGSVRMTKMIEDVLAFARLGASIEKTPVDLAKVAAEVVADLSSHLDGVDLELGPLPTVPGEEVQLRSLLQNLLSNAVKFRSEDRSPTIVVRSSRVGSSWRIEVVDNGIGVPDDQRDRIFEPMVRLDKRIEGVGIGLATCRRVVDSHGGAIGVDTAPAGAGAAFWVELPA